MSNQSKGNKRLAEIKVKMLNMVDDVMVGVGYKGNNKTDLDQMQFERTVTYRTATVGHHMMMNMDEVIMTIFCIYVTTM